MIYNVVKGGFKKTGIYGFEIDKTNSNPATCVTYTDDAKTMKPSVMNNGVYTDNGWIQVWRDICGMKPCITNSSGSSVTYLSDDDYAKDSIGNAVTLPQLGDSQKYGITYYYSEVTNHVAIEFTKCYVKFDDTASKLKVQISKAAMEGFSDWHFSKGGTVFDKIYFGAYPAGIYKSGYKENSFTAPIYKDVACSLNSMLPGTNYTKNSYDTDSANSGGVPVYFQFVTLLQVMAIMQFRRLDIASHFSTASIVGGGSSNVASGSQNALGLYTPQKCFGIEHFWANDQFEYEQGISCDNTTINAGESIITGADAIRSGYVKTVQGTNKGGFFVKPWNADAFSGSSTTYYTGQQNAAIGYSRAARCRKDNLFNVFMDFDGSAGDSSVHSRLCFYV